MPLLSDSGRSLFGPTSVRSPCLLQLLLLPQPSWRVLGAGRTAVTLKLLLSPRLQQGPCFLASGQLSRSPFASCPSASSGEILRRGAPRPLSCAGLSRGPISSSPCASVSPLQRGGLAAEAEFGRAVTISESVHFSPAGRRSVGRAQRVSAAVPVPPHLVCCG